MPDPDDFEDATLAYGDEIDLTTIFDLLDLDNDCTDAGGHVWLAQGGDVKCVHCSMPAMPVYRTREAE